MTKKETLLKILAEKTNINPLNYNSKENEFLKIEAFFKVSNVHIHKLNGTYQIQFKPAEHEVAMVIELFVLIFSNFSEEDTNLFKNNLENEKYVNENFSTANKVELALKKDDGSFTIIYFE